MNFLIIAPSGHHYCYLPKKTAHSFGMLEEFLLSPNTKKIIKEIMNVAGESFK